MTAAGNGEILRLLPRVSPASVLLVVAFLAASCATEQTDSSAPAVAFATAPSPRATSAPIITRLSIPRQTDALRLKVAPDHRHVLAMGGDVATFFDLSGNTLATVDRRAPRPHLGGVASGRIGCDLRERAAGSAAARPVGDPVGSTSGRPRTRGRSGHRRATSVT